MCADKPPDITGNILHDLFVHSLLCCYWQNAEGDIRYCSPAFEKTTGWSLPELKSNPDLILQLIHPEDRVKWQAHHKKETAKDPISFTLRLSNNNEISLMRYSCLPVYTENGTLQGRWQTFKEIDTLGEKPPLEDNQVLFNFGPVVIFKWRNLPGWPVAYVSENVSEIFGYKADDFLQGRVSYSELIDERDLPRVAEEVEQNSASDTVTFHHQPYRIKNKNGEIIWLLDYTRIERNTRGEVVNYLGYVIDISQQILREDQLKQAKHQLEILQQTIAALNQARNTRELYTIAKKGIIDLLQADRVSILLFGDDQRVHFTSWHGLSAAYRRAVDGHCPWSIDETDARIFYYEDVAASDLEPDLKHTILQEGIRSLMFVPLKGVTRLLGKFMVYFNSPKHYDDSIIRLTQMLSENLSAVILRLSVLEQTHLAEEKYRSIFENASEGIYQSTPGGKFLTVNPAMVRLFGYGNAEEMLKIKNTKELYWDKNERQRLAGLVNHKNEIRNIEVKMKRKDGSLLWVLMNDRAVKNKNGKTVYFEGMLVDITERKRSEHELRRNIREQNIINRILHINLQSGTLKEKLTQAQKIIEETPFLPLLKHNALFTNHPENNELCLLSVHNTSQSFNETYFCVPHNKCLCGKAARSKKIMYSTRIAKNCKQIYTGVEKAGHYSVPIISQNNVLGAITLLLHHDYRPNEEDKQFLMNISRVLAILIEQARAKEALEQQLTFSQAINHIAQKIILENDRGALLKTITLNAGETLKATTTSIYRIDKKNQKINILYRWLNQKAVSVFDQNILKIREYPCSLFRKSIAYVEKHKQYIESHHNDINRLILEEKSHQLLHEKLKIKSLLWYPFAFDENTFYILITNHIDKRHTWQKYEIGFIKTLTRHAELALMKIRFLEEKQKNAATLQQFATIVEQARESIILMNADGIIQYVNPANEQMTGYKNEEWTGQHFYSLKHTFENPELPQIMWQAVLTSHFWAGHVNRIRKDGKRYIEDVNIFPLINETGEIIQICKMSRDITQEHELKLQLQQIQKMEAVGTLAGGIAHDFNNLLTIINGYTELALLQSNTPPAITQSLTAISEAGERAEELTRQLLAFSRKSVTSSEIIDLNSIVSSMEKLLKRLISEDIQLEFNLCEEPAAIKADAGQIEQILTNLIVNARDAVSSGNNNHKIITVKTGKMRIKDKQTSPLPIIDKGAYVCLSVTDTGMGMDEQTRSRIFEPFFTTKEKYKGTGMGLSMVYGFVKQFNGHITVESEPDKGTTFTIYWPATKEKPTVISKKQNHVLPRGSESVFIVEDDTSVRQFTVHALKTLGYSVHSAANGREALDMLKKETMSIDIIITDMIMPGINGRELAKKILQRIPGLPVIYISGYTDNQLLQSEVDEKGLNFIQKPFYMETLAHTLRSVLDEAGRNKK